MAELGETQEPAGLVPGEPGALRSTAASLGRFSDALLRAGDGFRRIDDGGWTGVEADAFRQFFDSEPARWTTGGDCFRAAQQALIRYAVTLEWAQGQAAYAVELWERGEQATEQARAEHEQQQLLVLQAAAAAGQPPPAAEPFRDPGEPLRGDARVLLERARDQLHVAGVEAADEMDRAQQPAPEMPSLLERAVDGVTDLVGGAIRGAGDFIGGGVRAAGEGVDSVLDAVGDVAEGVIVGAGDVVGGGLEWVGDRTGVGGLSAAGDRFRDLTEQAGDRVDATADAAGDAVRYGADDVADGIEEAAEGVADHLEGDDDGDIGGDDGGGPDDGGDPGEGGPDDGDDGGGPGDDDGTGDEDDEPGDGDEDDTGAEDEQEDDQDVDRNGHWEDANGDKPDPEEISAENARTHILYGDGEGSGGHRHDSGMPEKTTFPPDWDDDKIIDEVEDVAKNPDSPPVYQEDRETWVVQGTRDGVDIVVIVAPDGEVRTGYPTGGEGVHRNDENGEPQPHEQD